MFTRPEWVATKGAARVESALTMARLPPPLPSRARLLPAPPALPALVPALPALVNARKALAPALPPALPRRPLAASKPVAVGKPAVVIAVVADDEASMAKTIERPPTPMAMIITSALPTLALPALPPKSTPLVIPTVIAPKPALLDVISKTVASTADSVLARATVIATTLSADRRTPSFLGGLALACVFAGLVGGLFGLPASSSRHAAAVAAGNDARSPHIAVVTEAREEITEPPQMAPEKLAVTPDPSETATPLASAAPRAVHHHVGSFGHMGSDRVARGTTSTRHAVR
jgi:hypothetical protein